MMLELEALVPKGCVLCESLVPNNDFGDMFDDKPQAKRFGQNGTWVTQPNHCDSRCKDTQELSHLSRGVCGDGVNPNAFGE